MKKFPYTTLVLGATVTLAFVVGLTFSRMSARQTHAPTAAQSVVAQASAPPLTEAGSQVSHGGPREAIQVHGHWTIDVRNPDGSLASHQEFENALVPGPTLASILGRTSTAGAWSIVVLGSPVAPCVAEGDAIGCTLVEKNFPSLDFYRWNTLEVRTPTEGANANAVVLTGHFTAGKDTNVKTVSTALSTCGSDVTPDSCRVQFAPQPFTAVTLPDPVNGSCAPNTACAVHVISGQIVQVTVTISFS